MCVCVCVCVCIYIYIYIYIYISYECGQGPRIGNPCHKPKRSLVFITSTIFSITHPRQAIYIYIYIYIYKTETRSRNHCWRGIAVLYTLSCVCVCACVRVGGVRYPEGNAHAAFWLQHIFPHYLIYGTIFGKKLLKIKCVF